MTPAGPVTPQLRAGVDCHVSRRAHVDKSWSPPLDPCVVRRRRGVNVCVAGPFSTACYAPLSCSVSSPATAAPRDSRGMPVQVTTWTPCVKCVLDSILPDPFDAGSNRRGPDGAAVDHRRPSPRPPAQSRCPVHPLTRCLHFLTVPWQSSQAGKIIGTRDLSKPGPPRGVSPRPASDAEAQVDADAGPDAGPTAGPDAGPEADAPQHNARDRVCCTSSPAPAAGTDLERPPPRWLRAAGTLRPRPGTQTACRGRAGRAQRGDW